MIKAYDKAYDDETKRIYRLRLRVLESQIHRAGDDMADDFDQSKLDALLSNYKDLIRFGQRMFKK